MNTYKFPDYCILANMISHLQYANFSDCLKHRLLWEWGQGVHVHDSQPGSPNSKKISKQVMLDFVCKMAVHR